MSAQILQFPLRSTWPTEPDEYRIELGRMLARPGESVSDDKARETARNFLSVLAMTHVITAGMTADERQQRLADMVGDAWSDAAAK